MEKSILLCWIGQHDLNASQGKGEGLGPIAQAATTLAFGEIHLLYSFDENECNKYENWLQGQVSCPVRRHRAALENPMHYSQIYNAAKELIEDLLNKYKNTVFTLHLSPGTSAMAAVWLILGKVDIRAMSGRPARLIQSSLEQGVQEADFPFDLLAVFKEAIKDRMYPDRPEGFVARDPATLAALKLLDQVATWSTIRVLITGETGTGKEEFAKLIRKAHVQKGQTTEDIPFVAINCAAIPETLIESELFGVVKGTYTDAKKDRSGKFNQAKGGILFLDEVGELTASAQAKLLRAIQEKTITPVGGDKEIKVDDVRVVTATNRDLIQEVSRGKFRKDLYFRLAEAEVYLPPLCERKKDIIPLAQKHLKDMNKIGQEDIPGYRIKQFSKNAEQCLLEYSWPGNIRELQLVVKQAVIWSDSKVITASTLQPRLKKFTSELEKEHRLLLEIDGGINLREMLKGIKKYYVRKAYERTRNQDAAARLLGYPGRSSIYKYFPD